PHASRNRYRTSSRGATGCPAKIPGIESLARERARRHCLVAVLGSCRLTDDDGTSRLKPLDNNCILFRNEAFLQSGARGGANILCEDDVLDRNRHTIKRTEHLALRAPRVGSPGGGHGLIRTHGHEGSKHAVDLTNPL